MRINERTRVIGDRLILVPYRKHHVPKYHEWMSDPEIQELTASEPLSIEEEYEMQQTWQQDDNKLTFILLSRLMHLCSKNDDKIYQEIYSMIGDVNVFFNDENKNEVELDVMIGEGTQRGFGYGKEAVYLMMYYCLSTFDYIDTFIVKINETNEASIKMFENLSFKKYDYMSAFKQVCMRFTIEQQQQQQENKTKVDDVKQKLSSIKCVYLPNDILIDINYD